jgi:lysophospholipase L1-like esterase
VSGAYNQGLPLAYNQGKLEINRLVKLAIDDVVTSQTPTCAGSFEFHEAWNLFFKDDDRSGRFDVELFDDGVHPNERGYAKWLDDGDLFDKLTTTYG